MSVPSHLPLGRGKGRPGVSRPAFTKPTARQPNRGLTADDPEFTCTICRQVKPMDDNYRVKSKKGAKLSGWCTPCARKKHREAVAPCLDKRRGPDYKLPIIKTELFPVFDGKRECSNCRVVKDVESFYKDRTVSSGYQTICKKCRLTWRKEKWASLSTDQKRVIQAEVWRVWIWRRFWLTSEAYDEMLEAQGGVCAICKREFGRRLCVDHDHSCCPSEYTCGLCLRGLLCQMCNFTVGGIEQIGSTEPFADYLVRHARPLAS